MNGFLEKLEKEIAQTWKQILDNNRLSQLVMSQQFDIRLYALYLLETYHYTVHNSRNQALVGASLQPEADIHYLKFCFKHAYEEAGHELMALHDLKSLGNIVLPQPLPIAMESTQTLISFLYHISKTGNLNGRLGYSLWAEDAYTFIAPLLDVVRTLLKLKPAQMTFLVEHSNIDAEHIVQVRKMIERVAATKDDHDAIRSVAIRSLQLTGLVLNEVADQYQQLVLGRSTKYAFLSSL